MKIDPSQIIEIRFKSDKDEAWIVLPDRSEVVTASEAEQIAEEWKSYLNNKINNGD